MVAHASRASELEGQEPRKKCCNLTWSQVDLKSRKITVPAGQMKGKRPHEVPIHKDLAGILKSNLKAQSRLRPKALVIGKPVRQVRKSFHSALTRAKLPKMRWHDLRHTFASWMSTRCSFAALQQLLGHSPGSVTLQYTHVPFEELRKAVDSLPTLFRDVIRKSRDTVFALVTTDGFAYYQRVIWSLFGPAILYGIVQKTRRKDRVIRVEREERIGARWRFRDALLESEVSETLNTSFIERLILFIRHASAYLGRRTLAHARTEERLDDHLALVQWYYNFGRPHAALRFGREVRTPAEQAGLVSRKLTFRDLFAVLMIMMLRPLELRASCLRCREAA